MAAPRFAPVPPVEPVRAYESPEFVPPSWQPSRPADIEGRQPEGERLGYQGPDQGYILKLASLIRGDIKVTAGENVDDAIRGCTLVALRRASLYGRGPAMHDLTLALTIWGYLNPLAPADLVATRSRLFAGVASVHHYAESRKIADLVPESTLRMSPQQAAVQMPGAWRTLTGA